MATRQNVRDEALALSEDDRAGLAEDLLASLYPVESDDSNLARLLAERTTAGKEGRVIYRDPLEIVEIYARMKADRTGRAS